MFDVILCHENGTLALLQITIGDIWMHYSSDREVSDKKLRVITDFLRRSRTAIAAQADALPRP